MTKNNLFDIVMNYIDNNIHEETETIKKGIQKEIGYTSLDFGKFFSMLTGNESLFHYIASRRLYFAGEELRTLPDKRICNIAQDFGYSEQSALNRAMKQYYGFTPNDIRKYIFSIPNNKYKFSDFCIDKIPKNNRLEKITMKLFNNEDISIKDFEYLETLEQASDEYGFGIDTCYAIADIAERLEIPFNLLADKCFDLMIDIHSDPDYLPPKIELAIDLGISSDKELKEVCDYFKCEYYDLDTFMINAYRKQNQE